jgi:alkylation response protein AidB-like acyl-CoA dehydrogenase
MQDLSADQQFFRGTTSKFLDEQMPTGELRRRRDTQAGFDEKYWHRGADLGWTSLLVGEHLGGGTVSGDGLVDLSLVAYEFGRHAAPGPLVPDNIVAATLAAAGTDAHAGLIGDLLSGGSIASWALGEPPPHDRLGDVTLDIGVDGGDVALNGVKRPVESARQADHLLVTGRTGTGLTQVLVPTDAAGVSVEPMRTVDLTRRFDRVIFDDVRLPARTVIGEVGGAGGQVERQLQMALVLVNAECVGAMQTGFDMTLEWMFDRYSFGRPLASYQELKHRLADMKTWLEASHAISDAAAAAVGSGSPDGAELVSAAKAFIGEYGTQLLQDCVQLHGGIGVTFDHDLHLFLRRHTVNRALYGTPAEHRQRIADLVEQQKGVVA